MMNEAGQDRSPPSNRRLRVYVLVMALLAAVAVSLLPFEDLKRAPATLLLMVTLSALAGRRPIHIRTLRTAVSASDPFLFASLAVLGGLPAVLVGLVSILSSAFGAGLRLGSQKLLLNLAASAISVSGACWAYGLFMHGSGGGMQRVLPLAAATTVYFLANTSLVAGAISIDRREPFVSVWLGAGPWTAVTNYCGMTLAVALLYIFDHAGPAALVLGLPPLWLFLAYYRSHRDRLLEQQRRMDHILESNQRLEEKVRARTAQLADKVVELERAREHLRHLANTDELTLLPNRRRFQQYLVRELARGKRFHHPLSVLLIDVDRFKRINDEFGHPIGDLVLQQLATTIDHNIRSTDLAGRYGGEEFGVVLAETVKSGACVLAEQLRRQIAEQPFGPDEHTGPDRVTVSIGVASFPEDADDVEKLIEIADRRLYAAKEAGRNRISAGQAGVRSNIATSE
jgi:diguanylate cyclase (GGDEF)-like protein